MEEKNFFYFKVKVYLSETEVTWREGIVCAVDLAHASLILEDLFEDDLILVDELSSLQAEVGGVLIF